MTLSKTHLMFLYWLINLVTVPLFIDGIPLFDLITQSFFHTSFTRPFWWSLGSLHILPGSNEFQHWICCSIFYTSWKHSSSSYAEQVFWAYPQFHRISFLFLKSLLTKSSFYSWSNHQLLLMTYLIACLAKASQI